MTTTKSLLAAVAASTVVLAAGDARAQTTTSTATATTTTTPPPSPWTFKKSPGPTANYALGSAPGVDAMAFTLTATGIAPTTLKNMTFFVLGTLAKGDLVNYKLLYYPAGTTSAGTVVGESTGVAWTGGPNSSVTIDLASPIAVPASFTGAFVLRVDVQGKRSFSFQPTLRTVGVTEGFVTASEDLPLPGDVYKVN
jgi:hypothetical protein